MLMLLFHLGDNRYALPAAKVVEITPNVFLSAIAQAPAYVAGVFTYRGAQVPVIDLCQLLLNRPAEVLFTTRIVLVDYPCAEGTSRLLGLLAERVTDTRNLPVEAFTTTGVRSAGAPCLGEAAQTPEGLIQFVDVEHLLAPDVQAQLFPAEAG